MHQYKILAIPLAVWAGFFFATPFLGIIATSFLTKTVTGGARLPLTGQAYSSLVNPFFFSALIETSVITLATTFLCILIAFPCAYTMARSPRKLLWLTGIMIPFWTNLLVRVFAWIGILGNNGLVNRFLSATHLTEHPLQLLYTTPAVILVMIYTYIPFAILPLFSTLEKFDYTHIEAARDLGATTWQSLTRVMLPQIQPGITTACMFVAVPVFGNYVVPNIIGGATTSMMGNIIAREVLVTRNWPLASALATVIIGVTVFMVVRGLSSYTPYEKKA